jgi:hypothetical protein
MVIVPGLTAQADIRRALDKVIHSLQSSKRAKDLPNPPTNVAGVCVLDKEIIALMMELVQTSETVVNFYQSTRRYNPEDSHLQRLYSYIYKLRSHIGT